MIILKSQKYPFRDRAPEWVSSAALFFWGVAILFTPGLFDQEGYRPLVTLLPQYGWATLTIGIGLAKLALLSVDRFRPGFAHSRAFASAASISVWSALIVVSLFNFTERGSAVALYGVPFTLDFLALWWAAGDAKLADEAAKKNRGANVSN